MSNDTPLRTQENTQKKQFLDGLKNTVRLFENLKAILNHGTFPGHLAACIVELDQYADTMVSTATDQIKTMDPKFERSIHGRYSERCLSGSIADPGTREEKKKEAQEEKKEKVG